MSFSLAVGSECDPYLAFSSFGSDNFFITTLYAGYLSIGIFLLGNAN